jgi:hypothetical protein
MPSAQRRGPAWKLSALWHNILAQRFARGAVMSSDTNGLIKKIEELPAERIAEVEDFVDFLRARDRDRALVRAATAASLTSFAAIWDNPEDAVYDAL